MVQNLGAADFHPNNNHMLHEIKLKCYMGIAVECCFFFYHISQCILFGILTGILAVKAEKRNNLDTRMCFLSYKLLSSLLVNPFIYIFNIKIV